MTNSNAGEKKNMSLQCILPEKVRTYSKSDGNMS